MFRFILLSSWFVRRWKVTFCHLNELQFQLNFVSFFCFGFTFQVLWISLQWPICENSAKPLWLAFGGWSTATNLAVFLSSSQKIPNQLLSPEARHKLRILCRMLQPSHTWNSPNLRHADVLKTRKFWTIFHSSTNSPKQSGGKNWREKLKRKEKVPAFPNKRKRAFKLDASPTETETETTTKTTPSLMLSRPDVATSLLHTDDCAGPTTTKFAFGRRCFCVYFRRWLVPRCWPETILQSVWGMWGCVGELFALVVELFFQLSRGWNSGMSKWKIWSILLF